MTELVPLLFMYHRFGATYKFLTPSLLHLQNLTTWSCAPLSPTGTVPPNGRPEQLLRAEQKAMWRFFSNWWRIFGGSCPAHRHLFAAYRLASGTPHPHQRPEKSTGVWRAGLRRTRAGSHQTAAAHCPAVPDLTRSCRSWWLACPLWRSS